MTILVERQSPALLSVVTSSPTPSDLSATASPFVPCILQRKGGDCPIVDAVPDVTKQHLSLSKQDRPSLCWTASTSSISSFDSFDDSYDDDSRRVNFSDQLVTDVWTRERTLPEDVPNLFYSSQETQEFRRQYHAEIDRERDLLSLKEETRNGGGSRCDGNGNRCVRRISRVIIEHDNKQETFFQFPETPRSASSPPSPSFFDNDSFWSGSLTWY